MQDSSASAASLTLLDAGESVLFSLKIGSSEARLRDLEPEIPCSTTSITVETHSLSCVEDSVNLK